jgi:hypothetical protein
VARIPFIHLLTKHIGPSVALQEIIYGLVMALATVSAVSLVLGVDPATRDTIVLAVIGVNITWGLADMIMFIITKNFDRFRHQFMAEYIRNDLDGEYPLEAIEEDLSETIVGTLDPADQRKISLEIMEMEGRAVGRTPRHSAGHFIGGLVCLGLTTLTALLVVLPLLFLDPVSLGLRSSQITGIIFLFLVGYLWAPFAGLSKWSTGLIMTGSGIVIILATLVLGG